MPPDNIPALRERLARLEAQHTGLEGKHETAMSVMSKRLEEHIEETDRRFVAVQATVSNTHGSVETLATTVKEFISAHNAVEGQSKEKKLEWWQILAIIAAFTGPSLVEKLLKVVGF